jgi:hypothetical protein
MDDEHRRLLARAVRAEEDACELRERLAACYREVARVRSLVPRQMPQIDFKPATEDPLVRLFAALAPSPRETR